MCTCGMCPPACACVDSELELKGQGWGGAVMPIPTCGRFYTCVVAQWWINEDGGQL